MNSNIVQLLLLLSAVIVGSALGLSQLGIDSELLLDVAIISLLFSVFLQIPLSNFTSLHNIISYKRYLSIAWVLNFVVIPTIAFVLAVLFFQRESAVFLGILIYLIAPCTDWVLGFTKKCGGDEVANSLLLPINLLSQIVLLPIYLLLFIAVESVPQLNIMLETLLIWILLPFILAQLARFILIKISSRSSNLLERYPSILMDISLVVLIIQIFSLNIEVLIEQVSLIPLILLVVLIFFIIIYYIVKLVSKSFRLSNSLEKSLSMTTAARNAPLMFAVSLVLFPEMTIVHSIIIIGMLLEFPHLILLTHILSNSKIEN